MANAQLSLFLRHIRKLAGAGNATDRQLLHRFATQHEETAFELLVERHGPAVLGVCRRVLRHEQDAEDVFQATFLTLAQKASSIRKPESLGCWLYGVASRLAFKVRAKRKTVSLVREPLEPSAGHELCAALDEELSQLAQRYQAPIVLCYLEGKTREEAARQLGWSLGTLKLRLSQGREILRKRLTRRGLTLSAALTAIGLSRETVPAALVISTAKAAVCFATGSATGAVAQLAQGLLKGLILRRLKIVATLVLAVSFVGVGAGLIAHQVQRGKPESASRVVEAGKAEANEQARADRYGDPLPAGALLRLGTGRFLHTGIVRSIAFSSDGKTLASAGDDVRLWEVASGRELQQFSGHCPMVNAVAFSPDDKTVASAGIDRTIHLWDVQTGKEIRRLTGHQDGVNAIAFFPDGQRLASGGGDQTIRFWDLQTGAEYRRCAADPGKVGSLQFKRDGRTLVSASRDAGIHLWDAESGKELPRSSELPSRYSIALAPDGARFAAGNGDQRSASLWDLATGKALREFQGGRREYGHLAFSPDGRMLASGGIDGNLRLWDVASGNEMHRTEGFLAPGVWALAFSPDGKMVATGSMDRKVRLWEIPSLRQIYPFQGHRYGLASLAYSSDGKSLLSTGHDGAVCVWDAANGNELRRFLVHRIGTSFCQAYAPDRHLLFTDNWDKTIRVWDTTSGRERQRFDWAGGSCVAFFLSPDGKVLVAGLRDQEIRLYDLATGKELRLLAGKQQFPRPAIFSPTGKWLAATCFSQSLSTADLSSQLKVWSIATGEEHCSFQGRQVTLESPVAFSPDAKLLAAETADQSTQVWEVATGKKVCHLDQQRARSLVFSPDGRTMASGHWDGTVHVWEVATGKRIYRFEGHKARVFQLTFSPDGKTLASGSEDNTALIWDLAGGRFHRAILSSQQLESLWIDLCGTDASRAYRAIWAFAFAPQQAIPFLKAQLQRVLPDPAEEQKRIRRLIAELDSNQFQLRQHAARELERLGTLAEPALRDALRGQSSPEVRRRLEGILATIQEWALPPDTLTRLRIIGVLEQIGSPEARQVLEGIAKGAPEARLRQDAKASLERLTKRP